MTIFTTHPPVGHGHRDMPGRRRNRTLRFLAVAETTHVDVDGITIVGARSHWHIDAAHIGIDYDEHERAWIVDDGTGDWFLARDPHAAIAALRAEGALPKANR